MMKCVIRENETMTLHRFCKGLNDDFIKKGQAYSCF